MGCNNKISHTCTGSTNFATCIQYEGEVNQNSSLIELNCRSVEETTEDIYTQLEEINLSELGENCLDYVLTTEGKIIVKNVLLKYEEEICNLKTQVQDLQSTDICNKSIASCNLDLNGLVDQCGEQPETLGELLQVLINNIQP